MSHQAAAVVGFGFLFLSLVFLGTWPAILRLCCAPNTSQQTCFCFQNAQSRDARFVYIDYAIAYVVSSSVPLIFELALAEETITDANDDGKIFLVVVALIGGSLLSLGNMTMQWATAVFGASLTTVVAIQASLTVFLGTSINFYLEPEKTDRADYLTTGILLFLLAITLAARAHLLYGEEKKLPSLEGIELGQPNASYGSISSNDSLESSESLEAGLAQSIRLDNMVHTKEFDHAPKVALAITIFGGFCFGFFSPAFNLAVNNPFQWDNGGALTVPKANLWFSLAFGIASIVGNVLLMYKPPVRSGLVKVTLLEYYNEPMARRSLAILAGFLCGSGNLFQFQGGSLVGFATADLVQAFPIVSTVWDVILFGEFRSAGTSVILYICAVYATYISGIGFLMASAA